MTAPCPKCGADASMQPNMRCVHTIVNEPGNKRDLGARTYFLCHAPEHGKHPVPFSLPYEETL